MAWLGVSKCGAPADEQTGFTGTVLAVPGVAERAHGTVVVVTVEAAVAGAAVGNTGTVVVVGMVDVAAGAAVIEVDDSGAAPLEL